MCKCPVTTGEEGHDPMGTQGPYGELELDYSFPHDQEGFAFSGSLDSIYTQGSAASAMDCLGTLAENGPGEALTEGGVDGGMWDSLVSVYDSIDRLTEDEESDDPQQSEEALPGAHEYHTCEYDDYFEQLNRHEFDGEHAGPEFGGHHSSSYSFHAPGDYDKPYS